MEEMFFCPSCMAKAAPVDGKCPVCGHDVNIENAPHQLPVNTILNGRYIIGRVLGAGGFGITYIGYDLKLDGKVAVKEYYPSGAANRSSSLTVFPTTEVNGNPFEIGKDHFEMGVCRRGHMGGEQGHHCRDRQWPVRFG